MSGSAAPPGQEIYALVVSPLQPHMSEFPGYPLVLRRIRDPLWAVDGPLWDHIVIAITPEGGVL